ncbi:MAG: ATP-binding protein [Candidatus Gastranaerophilales bacterium]
MKRVFVKTKNIKSFIAVATRLKNIQGNLPKMGLIYGEPGLGKTNAILWWAIQQDAILLTAKNGMTARWFLSDLVSELGETPLYQRCDLFEQAVKKLIEKPRMLIVDEIDYLAGKDAAIETIRDLHDRCGIPVLMIGMDNADKKLSRCKHFFDRIVEIFRFTSFDFDDVKDIVNQLSEVKIDDEVIEIIHQKANRFRQIVKLILKIENFALTNDYEVITRKELAW